jgi:hypothetical protein
MKPTEIIKAEAEKTGHNANAWLLAIKKLIDKGLGLMLQENNSILLVIQLGDGNIEIHLFTTDSPNVIIDSVKKFITKIKNSDVKVVYMPTPDDPNIIKVLKRLGLNVQESDRPKYAWRIVL